MSVNEKEKKVEMSRIRIGLKRAQMTEDEAEEEREENRTRMGFKRALMMDEEIEYRRNCDRLQYALKRARMTDEDLERERESNRSNKINLRKSLKRDFDQLFSVAGDHKNAFFYELGQFNLKCSKCKSLHFPEEISERIKVSCCRGGKLLKLEEKLEEYPEELKVLFHKDHPYHKNFITNIRRYNSAFAWASISCFKFKFPTPGPPCYKIQGQLYHKFNSHAMPVNEQETPTNGQLYFIDSEEAVDIRTEKNKECNSNIMNYIDAYIRENNKYAKSFQLMKDVFEEQKEKSQKEGIKMSEIRLLFSLKENYDQRRYNMPQSNEVCAIMVCDANDDIPPAKIVVYPKGEKTLKDIYPLDKCIEPMCYPLLYPTSTEGYYIGMKDSNVY